MTRCSQSQHLRVRLIGFMYGYIMSIFFPGFGFTTHIFFSLYKYLYNVNVCLLCVGVCLCAFKDKKLMAAVSYASPESLQNGVTV